VRLSFLRVLVFATLVILPWAIVFNQSLITGRNAPAAATTTPATTTATRDSTTNPALHLPAGPWGELEYTPITIEPPEDTVHRFESVETGIWHFRDCTRDGLARLLNDAGVTTAQRDTLLAAASPDPSANGFTIGPDEATLVAITPEARAKIYHTLALDPRNAQSEPFRHNADGSDWFADTGLPAETIALARKFLYRRGNLECFADISALLPAIPNADDRARFFKTLASQSAMIVRLRVRPDTDIDALVKYWGRGHLEREVTPLLESLARVPGGGTIDVAQLLPTFARTHLNTYPPLVNVDGTVQGIFDCHWTCLNFWNTVPDMSFTDPAIAGNQFSTAYHKVDKPDQLGDVIMLTRPGGRGIHSAVFVGGDVVFTKNGAAITAPWILARLPDVISYYEPLGPLKMIAFRRNDF
jgi:hypothetical protein